MALGTLTATAPVVIDESGNVIAGRVIVTARAAEARYMSLMAEAARLERVMLGQEAPTEDDKVNVSTWHLTFRAQMESALKQAEMWASREDIARAEGRIGRSQVVADSEVTGTALRKGYRRGEDGKGRF